VIFTTTPIAELTKPACNNVIFFPQVADGGGYVTQFILIGADGASSTTLNCFGEDGTALAVVK
jgi:hypothetical protein